MREAISMRSFRNREETSIEDREYIDSLWTCSLPEISVYFYSYTRDTFAYGEVEAFGVYELSDHRYRTPT